jgi:hypothetical protein
MIHSGDKRHFLLFYRKPIKVSIISAFFLTTVLLSLVTTVYELFYNDLIYHSENCQKRHIKA